jgi:group I intron endonuclease
LPSGFSTLFALNDQPGIYFFRSSERESSYIGSTINLYARCRAHLSHSKNAITRHPKLYSFVNKYGWESMEVIILTLVEDHAKAFKLKYPHLDLTQQDSDLLFLLTKYELLVTEQFCIDKLQPTLNINLLVNWGGQPNKGATGYQVSEDQKLERGKI